jgi:bacterioferritin
MKPGEFVRDMTEIRKLARSHLEQGALTTNYEGDVKVAIELLNSAIATELVCVLRYKFHAAMATGLASESVRAEFAQHALEEEQHLDLLCERVNQLGGSPNLRPKGLAERSATEYVEGSNLIDMIREDLVAERIGIELYRDMARYFAEKDPSTRMLIERILAQEEEHANDMRDLLVAHQAPARLQS